MSTSMNVIVAINSDYLVQCETMIFSLLRHNVQYDIKIHILNRNLLESQLESLGGFIESHGGRYKVYDINDRVFDELTLGLDRFSVEMYFRILAYRILPDDVERAMWLDSDLVVLGDIGGFYFQDFNEKELIVCKDAYCDSQFIQEIKTKMNLSQDHLYFNSGVIIFNFSLMRKEITSESISNVVNRYKSCLTYPDQDLLNKIYTNKVKYCDWREFNFQVNEVYKCNLDKIKILHYAGVRKPWLPAKAYPICKNYWIERFLLKDYIGVIKFYLVYTILFLPKKMKRYLRRKNENRNT